MDSLGDIKLWAGAVTAASPVSHPNGLPKNHQEGMAIAAIQTIMPREREFCPGH